jgi:hypothetical protein
MATQQLENADQLIDSVETDCSEPDEGEAAA